MKTPTITTAQINELYGKLSKDLLHNLTANIHSAQEVTLKQLPLWLLESMQLVAKHTNNKESLSIIEREIKLNLEAQARAERAEQKAKKAEQWAKECENLGKEIDEFENYIKSKYKT